MQYLSVADFCTRFGIGKTLAYDLINSGKLHAVKLGRRTLIPAEAAEAWAKSLPAFPNKGNAA